MSQRILIVLVIGPYEAQEDNEINLVEGEYIYDVDQLDDDGMWEGTNQDGKRGMFPASYVEEYVFPSKGGARPLPPLSRVVKAAPNTMTPGMQKSPPGQKKKKKKGKGGDDDSKFSKAQPASIGRGSSSTARNRFIALEEESGD